jgi:hypothetical protein
MLALNGGRPELMNLKGMIGAFVFFREEVVTRRTRHELTKARDRGHTLVGLAVAVANIDEVIALIRAAPDTATARDQLMARAWPAKDVGPLVALIADPRHLVTAENTIRLTEEQAKAILEIRCALDRSALPRSPVARHCHRGLPGHLCSRPACSPSSRASCGGGVRDAAQDENVQAEIEVGDEDLISGRGRHRHPCRLSNARLWRISRAGPWREGPRRHGDARGRDFVTLFVANTTRHFCSFLHRHGLPDEGLAASEPQGRGRRW